MLLILCTLLTGQKVVDNEWKMENFILTFKYVTFLDVVFVIYSLGEQLRA